MRSAGFLAFCTGFLSLSMEILWLRLFAFANHSMPQAFAFVLAVYLVGIALGAHLGKVFCKRGADLWLVSGVALLVSCVCDLTGPWWYAHYVVSSHQLLIGGSIIAFSALTKAIVFPIAHHLGASKLGVNVGRSLSRIYVLNILGATLGPIFVGFVLLSLATTQQSFVLMALLALMLAINCLNHVWDKWIGRLAALALACQFVLMMFANSHILISKVATPGHIINIVENQHGIIIVYSDGSNDNIVVGGNVYDGRTNLDPVRNSNSLNRVLIMSALVDHPKRVLMIGLSVGSWLKMVTTFPGVESIDVVEINPGYIKLIENYPEQLTGLLDPRVNLYIDDGRRWLKTHPNNHYDMIVMNTTYHWRAYTSTLLSQEFLQILKSHLNQGGVLEYNMTGSLDAIKTAQAVFKYAYLYSNFVVAADFDWRPKLQTVSAIRQLAALRMDGRLLFPVGEERLIAQYLQLRTSQLDELEPFYHSLGRQFEIITDRNLITEFKYGRQL